MEERNDDLVPARPPILGSVKTASMALQTSEAACRHALNEIVKYIQDLQGNDKPVGWYELFKVKRMAQDSLAKAAAASK